MQNDHLPWEVARNRLAAGIYRYVAYQGGFINSYFVREGKVYTYRWGEAFQQEPVNPQYLFREISTPF